MSCHHPVARHAAPQCSGLPLSALCDPHTEERFCFFFFNEKVLTPLLGFLTSWELSDAVIQWDHQTRVEILVIK